jgi:hypothetical protein
MSRPKKVIVPNIPTIPDNSGTFKSLKEYKDVKARLSTFDKIKQFINKFNTL